MKYKAFVSHSRADAEFARRLHRWLEEFRVPESRSDTGDILESDRRLGTFFIDQAEIAVGTDLHQVIDAAIEDSEFFIAVCSRDSARSKWVKREIEAFIATRSRENMFGILAPGGGYTVNNIRNSKRFAILNAAGTRQATDRLIADPVNDGEENAFLRLTSGLLGIGFDDLVNRHSKRQELERRARRRLAAKVHTLPARAAFAAGQPELALKHALVSVLDGDDPSWSQAYELEATVAEYAWSVPDSRMIRIQTGPSKSSVFDTVLLTECRHYVITGTRKGEISVWDSESGNPLAKLLRREAWHSLPRDQQEADPSARSWHHPILAMAQSPDRRTLLIAHGDYSATLWSTEDWRQLGFVEHAHFVIDVIAFSNDSSKVAIACAPNNYHGNFSDCIHMVDCRTGVLLAKSDFRSWNVGDLTFSPGDEEVVIGSLDGAIVRLDSKSGKILAEHPLKLKRVRSAKFSPDGTRVLFVSAGEPPATWVRDPSGHWIGPHAIPHGSSKTLTSGSGRTVLSVSCSPDWRRACVSGFDVDVCLWDLTSREMLRTLGKDLTGAQFSPGGTVLATNRDRTAVCLHNGLTGEPIAVLKTEESKVSLPRTASIFGDNDRLIAVEANPSEHPPLSLEDVPDLFSGYLRTTKSVLVYDTRTGSLVDQISRPGLQVDVVGFSASGKRLWVLIDETDLHVRELQRGRQLATFKVDADGEEYSRRLTDRRLALAQSGRYLAVAIRMRRISVFDPVSGVLFKTIELERAEIANFAFGHEGTVLVLACSDGTVRTFDVLSGRPPGIFQDHPTGTLVDLLVVSPDGSLIATASAEDTRGPVVVRDISSNSAPISLGAQNPREIRTMAFSADSKKVVVTDIHGEVAVWDIGSRRELTRGEPGLPNRGIAVSLCPDGRTILAADAFGQVRVYTADHGDLVHEADPSFTTCAAGLEDAKFTADGLRLVAAERTNVQLIDMASGVRVVLHDGDEWPIPPFTISSSGRFLATNSADGAVRVWRTDHALRVCVLKGHAASIAGLEFSSDEQMLATSDINGRVFTWDIQTASLAGKELTAWLCERLKGDLTTIYGQDLENMLLRDLVHPVTGNGLNLVDQILDRWPELKELTTAFSPP